MAELDLKKDMFRSWFCVFNNPEEHGYIGTEQEICDKIVADWVDSNPTRSCAVCYCVSADGLKHCHVVLEDTKNLRFSAVKKAFPSMHIEPTKGSKEQAEDYINKRGKWEEKGEKIVATARYGEIKGAQGQRRDFDAIDDLLLQGMNPSQIMEQSFAFRRFDKMIRQAYFDKRMRETPVKRDVSVYWHCGEAGSGKTYVFVKLCQKYGEDSVYLLNDYDKGGFDNYAGQKILCMDEFRGQMRFALLMQYLDGYRVQIPCRYANAFALWDEVHIFTVMPPEMVYKAMVDENRGVDTYEQLKRRIKAVVYHYKDMEKGDFRSLEVSMQDYVSYSDLKFRAENGVVSPVDGFIELPSDDSKGVPF